jgi:hypothetical protein
LKPKEIKLTGKEFNEYLLADGLPNIYELRKKEGILDKDAVEYYSKYPKPNDLKFKSCIAHHFLFNNLRTYASMCASSLPESPFS